MRATLLLPLAFALALANPVGADHCTTWSTDPDVELDTNPTGVGPRYYVDNDPVNLPCCPFGSWWVYEESNGIPGLQRSDEERDDTCHGMIRADTIIF